MSDIAERIAALKHEAALAATDGEHHICIAPFFALDLIAYIRAMEEDRKHNYDCWIESLDRNAELLAELAALRDQIKLTEEQAAESDHEDVGLESGWYECIDNWDEYTEKKNPHD